MPMRASDKIVAVSRGTAKQFLQNLPGADDADREFLPALESDCEKGGVDFSIASNQGAWETNDYTSPRYINDKNSGGIFIPSDDTVQPFTVKSYTDAARLHFQCLYSIVNRKFHPKLPIPKYAEKMMREVWLKKVNDPKFPRVQSLDDLNIRYIDSNGEPQATWAWDRDAPNQEYEAGVIAKSKRFLPGLPDQAQIGTPPMKGTPVYRNILPYSAPNRPGTKLPRTGQLYIVVHETGNPGVGADADNQIAYLFSSEAKSRSVSYHLSVDDHQIVQGLPLDEIGYHAGDGCDEPTKDIGCFRSIAIEACINADGNETQMRKNLAELIARLCAGDDAFDWGDGSTKDRFDIDHILQHYQVNQDSGPDRHYCPQHILQQGYWPVLMSQVDTAWATWGHASPGPIGFTKANPFPKNNNVDVKFNGTLWYACTRTVKAVEGGAFHAYADDAAPFTRKPASANEGFTVSRAVKASDGNWWWVTPRGSRIKMSDTNTSVVFTKR